MLNKININPRRRALIFQVVLAAATLVVFWQVNNFEFINVDDPLYVTTNTHVQSGITLEGVRWAFSTIDALYYWYPLTWLSLMLDYQLHGLNAGAYHLTNLVLHIMSTLLLFWLLNRVTGKILPSAFIAGLFALHPLRVESVAFVAERKDVLCAFFWMLTLCFYVYHAEKPDIKRYLLVLFSFACALMSKPMAVTLPVMMILLDYWPLGRFETQRGNVILWQVKEKGSFFILSAVISAITLYAQPKISLDYGHSFSLGSRIANASVSFVSYLEKMFWPHDLAAFYVFPNQPPLWQIMGAVFLIFLISITVIVTAKRLPYLFVGWLWYAITILPVIGIIRIANTGNRVMADYFTYLPSIGIAIMLVGGLSFLFHRENMRKKILFPAGITVLVLMSALTWRQCGYWKNSMELVNHTLRVTKDNYLAYLIRGKTYYLSGQYQHAITDCNESIRLKPDFVPAYYSRGVVYDYLGQRERAIADYNEAIRLQPDFMPAYRNRGIDYGKHLRQYQKAIEDFNAVIKLQPNYAGAYRNRGLIYLIQGNKKLGCRDAQKACYLGDCVLWKDFKVQEYCR